MTRNAWIRSLGTDHSALESRHGKLRRICQRAIDLVEDNSAGNVERFHIILNDLAGYAHEQFRHEASQSSGRDSALLERHRAESMHYETELTDLLMSASTGACDKRRLLLLLMEWWSSLVSQSGRDINTPAA